LAADINKKPTSPSAALGKKKKERGKRLNKKKGDEGSAYCITAAARKS